MDNKIFKGRLLNFSVVALLTLSSGSPVVWADSTSTTDTTAPLLQNVTVGQSVVGAGQSETVYVTASDDISGVQYVFVHATSPSGAQAYGVEVSSPDSQGRWVAQLHIPEHAEQGKWIVDEIGLADNTGNTRYLTYGKDYSVDFNVDTIPPAAPAVNSVGDSDTDVTGTAEAGSIVTVKSSDTILGTATAGSDGSFSVVIPRQTAGTTLSIAATDAAGNVSDATSVTVKDTTAPAAPQVNSVGDSDTDVTGTAEAGSIVTVKSSNTILGTARAGSDGSFSVVIPRQTAGTTLSITATDAAGNVSDVTSVTVKDIPPANPIVNSVGDSSSTVTGKAEVGSKITVKTGSKILGTAIVGKSGTFAVTITKQKAGTVLSVTATDAAGNVSAATSVTVKDTTPPAKPIVNSVGDSSSTVTGKAEVGSKITVKTGSKILGTAIVGKSGTFAVTITKQKAGTVLSVTATDAAGNVSAATGVTVRKVSR